MFKLPGNNTFVWEYYCRHIVHDVPFTPDVITDYDPKYDVLDFSALYFEVVLETYEYLNQTILDTFPVRSGIMITVKYDGASSDFVLLEGFFGTLSDMTTIMYPAASDEFKPCLPGDEECYEARCNIALPIAVTLTPKNYNGCMQVNGEGKDDDDFILATCNASDPRQQFVLEASQMKLALDPTKCAQAGRLNPKPSHGHFLRVFSCDAMNAQQQITWNDSTLMLVPFGLAVVFQGVTADVDSDGIIVGDLSRPGVLARKDWVPFES